MFKYYVFVISFLALTLAGCRDIVVNVPPEPPADTVAIAGTWSGPFGTYDERGEQTSNESLIRRRDTIRFSIGETNDLYEAHGVWTIAVYSYIEQGFTSAGYAFSASVVDTGSGLYSMRLHVNQGSAIYEMRVENDRLIVYRPDLGYTHVLTRVRPLIASAKGQ